LSILKKILLAVASIFLAYQSVRSLFYINEVTTDSWILIIFIAWALNMFITGTFAFSGFAFSTQKLLPAFYYKVKNPTELKKTYQFLRVYLFRKFLLATFWRNKQQRKNFFNGKVGGIATFEEQSMKSEFGHLIPFVIINIIGVYLLAIGLFKLGFCCVLINIIGNLYPVILQRHHRMRIQLLRNRF
jgi:Co/Zn/Cd efflux system component